MKPIIALALLAGGALPAADREPDGWVVAVTVNGWTRAGVRLMQFDPIFVNDKLVGTAGDIRVALKDGQSPHVYHCDKAPCPVTIPEFRPAEDSLLARLGRGFAELASHRDKMPVSAISRGSEHLHPSVLAWTEGRLDLKDAVGSIDSGAYSAALRPIETHDRTAPKLFRGSVTWDPPDSTSAPFPGLPPGIYELTMASTEGDSLGSVTVLVAAEPEYPAERKFFEDGVRSLPADLDSVTRDALLNALLFQAERRRP